MTCATREILNCKPLRKTSFVVATSDVTVIQTFIFIMGVVPYIAPGAFCGTAAGTALGAAYQYTAEGFVREEALIGPGLYGAMIGTIVETAFNTADHPEEKAPKGNETST